MGRWERNERKEEIGEGVRISRLKGREVTPPPLYHKRRLLITLYLLIDAC